MMPAMTAPIMRKVFESSFGCDVGAGVAAALQQKSTPHVAPPAGHSLFGSRCDLAGSMQSTVIHVFFFGAGVGTFVAGAGAGGPSQHVAEVVPTTVSGFKMITLGLVQPGDDWYFLHVASQHRASEHASVGHDVGALVG